MRWDALDQPFGAAWRGVLAWFSVQLLAAAIVQPSSWRSLPFVHWYLPGSSLLHGLVMAVDVATYPNSTAHHRYADTIAWPVVGLVVISLTLPPRCACGRSVRVVPVPESNSADPPSAAYCHTSVMTVVDLNSDGAVELEGRDFFPLTELSTDLAMLNESAMTIATCDTDDPRNNRVLGESDVSIQDL